MEFSKRLKELRLKHGLTQEELGRMLGVTGANCTRYEKGLAQPKMATLIKMSQIFGVSIDYLQEAYLNVVGDYFNDYKEEKIVNEKYPEVL